MSSNNDNAMTRFLFAILQQKCLKDIDWNKVAHDPILTQEITNGHAARMRYSRFRASMLGLEPQRRGRKASDKFKVVKSKKNDKNLPKTTAFSKDSPNLNNVMQNADVDDDASEQSIPAGGLVSPHIKTERGAASQRAALGGNHMLSPSQSELSYHHPMHVSEMQSRMRLLTPCSESDTLSVVGPSHGFVGTSPPQDMFTVEGPFDFAAAVPSHAANVAAAVRHGHAAPWHHSSSSVGGFSPSPFAVGYGFDGYQDFCYADAVAASPGHMLGGVAADHHPQQAADGLTLAPARVMMAHDSGVVVKQEEWDPSQQEIDQQDSEWAIV